MRAARRALTPITLLLAAATAAACGEASARDPLRTVFDSTSAPDTVIATTAGEVPRALVRAVTEELRIAPEVDDTTLFGEVFEFDVGADGRLYVYDYAGNQILLFGNDGTLIRRIGRAGSGPGEFNQNGGMLVLPDGRVAQWDSRNARMSFFTADGDFINQWTVPAGFSTSNGLRTDTSGTLYWYRPVTERREGEILGRMGLVRLADGGGFADSLVPPDLPVERITYISQQKNERGEVVGTSATGPAHAPGFLWGWHRDGHFVSIATSRYRVESSRPGRALRILRDAPPIPIPEDERAWDQERITFNMKQNQPTWSWSGPPIPTEKPPVAGLSLSRDGRIWIRVATPSELIPETERDEQLENRAPVRRYRDALEYEVFEKDGTFLGRVALPHRSTWMEADGDLVWYLQRDEDGLPAVVRARIAPGLDGRSGAGN